MCATPTALSSPCLALLRTSLQLMHGKWFCSHLHPWTDLVLLTPLTPSSRAKALPHHLPIHLPHLPFSSPIIHPNPNPSLLLLRTTLCILQSCSGGRNPPCNNPRSGQEHPPTYYLIFTSPNPLPWMQPFCRCHSSTFKDILRMGRTCSLGARNLPINTEPRPQVSCFPAPGRNIIPWAARPALHQPHLLPKRTKVLQSPSHSVK